MTAGTNLFLYELVSLAGGKNIGDEVPNQTDRNTMIGQSLEGDSEPSLNKSRVLLEIVQIFLVVFRFQLLA